MNEANLPDWLEHALESMQGASFQNLKEAYQNLSRRYHEDPKKAGICSPLEAQAYAWARLPATFAVAKVVLNHLPASFHPRSIVDFGSGPGTAIWAALDLFPGIEIIHYVENDPWMCQLFAQLHECRKAPITLHSQSFTNISVLPSGDLGIFCYSLNELEETKQLHLIEHLDNFQFLVLIFPGTPHHFSCLKKIRQRFIDLGWKIHAPCPHHLTCPMSAEDWCHFSERLTRLKHHRDIKEARLNWEDEKYSYLIVSKNPPAQESQGRLVKRPLKRSGHILIDVCQEGQLRRKTFSKKDPLYPYIKKCQWGDLLPHKQKN